MCDDKKKCNECNCIGDILRKILILQKQDFDNESYSGCDKPYLGPICNSVCYNTRPIMLYNCCTGTPWSFEYTLNNVTATSNIFRIESLDECCCTIRILGYDATTGTYTNTNEFATINLDCVGAIKCLADTYVDLC